MMRRTQFLLMSATLGDVSELAKDLSRRSGRTTAEVTGVARPVPLHFSYRVQTAHELVEDLLGTHTASGSRGTPAYLVSFNQVHAVAQAQALASIRVVDRRGRDEIAAAIGDFRFATGFGSALSRLVRSGIGVHHAGTSPKIPSPGRTIGAAGSLTRDLRHRHPGGRHQCADTHSGTHLTDKVRRGEDAQAHRARVPSDCGASWNAQVSTPKAMS